MKASISALGLILIAVAGASVVALCKRTPRGSHTEKPPVSRSTPETHLGHFEPAHEDVKEISRSHTAESADELHTEGALRDFFYSQPEAAPFDVISIECWKANCALRVITFANGEVPAQGVRSGAIRAIVDRYARSDLAKTVALDGLTTYYFDDSTVYELAFNRDPT